MTKRTRKNCQFCRFQACLRAGMKQSWVIADRTIKSVRSGGGGRGGGGKGSKAGKVVAKAGGLDAAAARKAAKPEKLPTEPLKKLEAEEAAAIAGYVAEWRQARESYAMGQAGQKVSSKSVSKPGLSRFRI